MGIFIAYMIKSGFCLLLFYLLYKWQLAKETFFRLNRIMLLGFWILAFLLPAIPLVNWGNTDLPAGLDVNRPEILNSLTNISLSAETNTDHQAFIWTWLICTGYIVGVVLIASKQLVSWTRLYLLIRRGRRIENGPFHLILIEGNQPPFSWMHYIVLSEKDYRENPTEILTHEMAHIRHHHSWDLLLADVGILLQWFNPAAWLLKQEMQSVHEYEADDAVLAVGVDAKSYQLLLIKKAVGTSRYTMANSFNHSSLKKRITMMLKEKSSPQARAKYIYILPLAALSVMAFARPEVSDASVVLTKAKVTDLWTIPQEKTPEVKAQFPGGENKFFRFIYQNFKYPTLALEAGKQGRVACLVTIGQDGNVNDVEITTSVDPALDAEVIRVMKKMPKWEPAQLAGKAIETKIPLGILFKIDGSDLKTENDNDIVVVGANESPNNRPALEVRGKGNPIYVIDGKICTKETFEKMTPDKINAVHILKPEEAIQKYGEQAKDGAILIITKQNKSDMKFYPATTDETSQKEAMKQYGEQARNGSPLIKLRSNPQ